MCVHCESKDFIKVEIRCKGQTYVPIGDGWGSHNPSNIVRNSKGEFRIYNLLGLDEVVTQPIEYCPKCGRKLGKEE